MPIYKFKNPKTGKIAKFQADTYEEAESAMDNYVSAVKPEGAMTGEKFDPYKAMATGYGVPGPLKVLPGLLGASSAGTFGALSQKPIETLTPAERVQAAASIASMAAMPGAAGAVAQVGKRALRPILGSVLGGEAGQALGGRIAETKAQELEATSPHLAEITRMAPSLIGGILGGIGGGLPLMRGRVPVKVGMEPQAVMKLAGEKFNVQEVPSVSKNAGRAEVGQALGEIRRPLGQQVAGAKAAIQESVGGNLEMAGNIQEVVKANLKRQKLASFTTTGEMIPETAQNKSAARFVNEILEDSQKATDTDALFNLRKRLADEITRVETPTTAGIKPPALEGPILKSALKAFDQTIDTYIPPDLKANLTAANKAFAENAGLQELVMKSFSGKKKTFSPEQFVTEWEKGLSAADKARRFSPEQIQAIDTLTKQPGSIMSYAMFPITKLLEGAQKVMAATALRGSVAGQLLGGRAKTATRLFQPNPNKLGIAGLLPLIGSQARPSLTGAIKERQNTQEQK